jgi:hypothetical protein
VGVKRGELVGPFGLSPGPPTSPVTTTTTIILLSSPYCRITILIIPYLFPFPNATKNYFSFLFFMRSHQKLLFFFLISTTKNQSCIFRFDTRFGLAIGIEYFGTGQYQRSVSSLLQIYINIYIYIYIYIYIATIDK